MNVVKKIDCSGVIALIVIGFITFGIIWAVSINYFGKPQMVTVSFYEVIHNQRGGNPLNVSCGYYYVHGKRHTALVTKIVPIGTRFEIKYSPIIPSEYNVQSIQE